MEWRSIGVLALSVLLATSCTREERSLNAQGLVSVERVPGGVQAVQMEARVHDRQLGEDAFAESWAVVTRGAATNSGFALTLGSAGGASTGGTTLMAAVTLVLPTPLRTGATFPVAHTLPAPREMPMYWATWGPRPLRDGGSAEIALRTFDYRAVGMVIENEFIAEAVSGTVSVTSTSGEQVVLRLDITATDTAGRIVRLNGDITLFGERYRPPFS